MVARSEKLWASGTKLTYFLRPGGTEADKNAIRDAFKRWQQVVALVFEEVFFPVAADIRIGFANDGAWSYVGKDILGIPRNQSTMNFGWSVADDPDTAMHEIGHTLGMSHEHQNPHAGIVWNKDAVRRSLGGPPNNWSLSQIESNVFAQLPANAVGSDFDANSIMEYPWGAGMIDEPVQYRSGLTPTPGLSFADIEWARRLYPEIDDGGRLELAVMQQVQLAEGEQAWFAFTSQQSRDYRFRTFGDNDTVIALFQGGKFLAGDDDSGEDKNAEIKIKVQSNVTVSMRLRMFWSDGNGDVTVVVE